ncbi:metal ABC transporter solute-binding protein, Zn/Mn family [Mycobacterium sp. PSTR-4-N]|uniref:metal ABC transporter solute-binding protein, Zn/Mn family n=1 Tax=Mycobacterium sp. PSTR-4-N TaxID=2917745 RepID=UPI001F1537C0|nr:zinc ABC transporter substrate-binding protein [Mycobacterium sp. PSTR-4-N]MCG7595360.1 zinc ABC transporter substrate-binding protein [Mycobacterium sp. PSTR-4-N]
MRALVAVPSVAMAALLVLTGCSQTPPNTEHGTLNVVASTDVWGSVAATVVGNHATVTSIVNGTVEDPHSFEASPAQVAQIADASLVVYNGDHYDHWMDDVLENSHDIPAIAAASLSPDQPPANEHRFYDLPTVKIVAENIADTLGKNDAEHAADYTANADKFGAALDTLILAQHGIGQAHPGASVVSTEPVAFYALRNAGIADKTPPSFANAVEEGGDPSPADLATVLDLIGKREVSAVVVNSQTAGPVTQQLSEAARRAVVPVVTVTETLPEGMDYLQWQRKVVDDMAAALDSPPPPSR